MWLLASVDQHVVPQVIGLLEGFVAVVTDVLPHCLTRVQQVVFPQMASSCE